MIPAVVLATTLLIAHGLQSAPLDERVYVLSQDERWGAYLSAPDQTAAERQNGLVMVCLVDAGQFPADRRLSQ